MVKKMSNNPYKDLYEDEETEIREPTYKERSVKVPEIIFNDGELKAFIDASYQLHSRETEFIDPIIYEVLRQKSVLAKIFPTVKIAKGAKEWKVSINEEPFAPKFDDNFLTESQSAVRKAESTFYPVFMHYDYRLAQVDQDAGVSSGYHKISPQRNTIRSLSAGMVEYKEKVLWRGYDITGRAAAAANPQGSIDSSVKGIMNTTGVETFNAGSGDSDIQSAGDGPIGLANAAGALAAVNYFGPYDLFVTPLVWAQLLSNKNATTGLSDWMIMLDERDTEGSKLVRSINVTKGPLNAAETGSTGKMVVIDRKNPDGSPTIVIGEEYAISNHPNKGEAMAISGKIIWSGVIGVLRPDAVAIDVDVTTS